MQFPSPLDYRVDNNPNGSAISAGPRDVVEFEPGIDHVDAIGMARVPFAPIEPQPIKCDRIPCSAG